MNAILKQRLVGAIVLISLAVIFLPMLFTGKGELGEKKFESQIPPEPAYEIKSPQVSVPLDLPSKRLEKVPLSEPVALEPEKKQPPVSHKPGDSDTSKTAKQDAAETKPEQVEKSTPVKSISEPIQIPPPAKKTQAKTSPESQKPAAKDIAGSSQKTAPVDKQKTKKSNTSGWVVQVGSFTKKPNATKLRNKLRNQGMASFVVTGKSDKGEVYRVRVGPEISRDDAEKLQEKIKQITKLTGLVMQYP